MARTIDDGSEAEDALRSTIDAAVRGDRRAAGSLLQERLPRVRNLVRYLVRGDDHVDDIAQQALLAILRGLPTFEGTGSFPAWCDRITAREAFAYLRRDRAEAAKRRDAAPEMRLLKGGLAGEAETHDPYADRRAAVQLLELLPEEQRSVVALHHIAGLSMPEIADLLDIPHETARSRARLGMKRLRDALADTTPPGGERHA